MMPSAPQGEAKRAGKSQTGALTNAFYAKQLELVKDAGEVFTLTISTGENERVFYFTRGAILFVALGTTGGAVLARKLLARKLLTQARIDELDKRRDEKHPLLQDVIRASEAIEGQVLNELVAELAEEHLLEVGAWESSIALYELVHGNVPGRLYSKGTPAVRVSTGVNGILERVIPRILEMPTKVLGPLGGTLRTKARLGSDRTPPLEPTQRQVVGLFSGEWRSCLRGLAQAYDRGIAAHEAASALAGLVSSRRLICDPAALGKEEELAAAEKIQASLDSFLNGFLARSHLSRIYERAEEKEKAIGELRSIAKEHLLRERLGDALNTLRHALKLGPEDLPAREDLIKVLVGAKRTPEAAREAVELGRQLLIRGLPGRARRALEMSLKLVPGAEGVLWMLAGLVERLGDKPEAIRRYGQIADVTLAKGDEPGYLAANQKLLELDPENDAARRKVLSLSGYRRAFYVRVATAVAAVLLGAFVLGSGTYQLLALEAFTKARDKAWAAIDEERFDLARSIVLSVRRDWTLARIGNVCADVLGIIDLEESLAAERHCKRAISAAARLEAEKKLPEAAETLRAVLPFAGENPERRGPVEAALQRDEQRLVDARKALEHAATFQGRFKRELIAQALDDFPWLRRTSGLLVPCEVTVVPPHARVTIDGAPVADQTPALVELPLAPSRLVAAAANCETVVLPNTVPLPAWQIAVALPRRRVWVAAEVSGSVPPALGENRVFAVGDDRTISGLVRDAGMVLWRSPLGVFGDTDAPAVISSGTVFVRTSAGTLLAFDPTTGKERWERTIKPPPLDADTAARAPVAASEGVLVREGGQGLALLAADDGALRWQRAVRGNMVGAPVVVGGLVFAASGRRLEVFQAASGASVRTSDLPVPATTGPVPGPDGHVFIGLEGGGIARFDASGAPRGAPSAVAPSGIVAIDGSPGALAVATANGEVLALDARLKLVAKIALDHGSVPRWVRLVAQDFIIVGDARGIVTFDARGVEQWRDLTNSAPVVADDALIYQCGPAGLTAVER
jgi:outer membrane protein assembly factor BamB